MTIRRLSFIIFLACSCLVITSSCNSENDYTHLKLKSRLSTGTWRITEFTRDGENKTNDLKDFSFTFTLFGGMDAILGTTTYDGLYNIPDIFVKSKITDITMTISQFALATLKDLNGQWRFLSESESQIQLRDININGTDLLTFQRI